MNEGFRAACDRMLLSTLDELRIPYHVVCGSLAERLERIAELCGLPVATGVDVAIARSSAEYALIDKRMETERARPVARASA